MPLLPLTKSKLLILGKSLYSFLYNRKDSLFCGKSFQFPNFVFVGQIPVDKIFKLSGAVVSFRCVCQVVSYVARFSFEI